MHRNHNGCNGPLPKHAALGRKSGYRNMIIAGRVSETVPVSLIAPEDRERRDEREVVIRGYRADTARNKIVYDMKLRHHQDLISAG